MRRIIFKGYLEALEVALKNEAVLQTLTPAVLKSIGIEGEVLDPGQG